MFKSTNTHSIYKRSLNYVYNQNTRQTKQSNLWDQQQTQGEKHLKKQKNSKDNKG